MRKNKSKTNQEAIQDASLEMNVSNEDQELIDQLMMSFEQMDHVIPHSTAPHVGHLERLVTEQKMAVRRRHHIELLCFFLVALVLIGGNTLLVMTSWTAFGIFQGVTLVAALGYLFGSYVRRKKKGDVQHAK
ncbi:YxlC family protein [Paenibacillus guangzhouensis]|uniref:YxlC family protein n=1 Tax=Paenibacillus guangzhouensis TaxID=1473112 RepID=UPI001267163E|nr:YxlC family protein [Paenibacillus guangzhouensis]